MKIRFQTVWERPWCCSSDAATNRSARDDVSHGRVNGRNADVVLSLGCRPFIEATRLHVSEADEKIAFDRFHVAKHIGDAVNKVRVDEHAELKALGDPLLTGTRYLWLPVLMRDGHGITLGEVTRVS
jgi:transposase